MVLAELVAFIGTLSAHPGLHPALYVRHSLLEGFIDHAVNRFVTSLREVQETDFGTLKVKS